MAMAKQHEVEDDLNATLDLAMQQLDGLSRSLDTEEEESDGPIDNFISEFLRRHQIGKEPSAPAAEVKSVVPEPVLTAAVSSATRQAPTATDRGTESVEDQPSRRPAKPSESVDDRMAMRQLANTIAKCVLESHGRVIMSQRALALFTLGMGSAVAATALSISAANVYSMMFFGALVWYGVAAYSTVHFWILTSKLNAGRSHKYIH